MDLSLVCSFSRMCELLGILKGSKDVTIQVVKEVQLLSLLMPLFSAHEDRIYCGKLCLLIVSSWEAA